MNEMPPEEQRPKMCLYDEDAEEWMTISFTDKGWALAQKIQKAFEPWCPALDRNLITENEVTFLWELPRCLENQTFDEEQFSGTTTAKKMKRHFRGFVKGYVAEMLDRLERLGLLRIDQLGGGLYRYTVKHEWIRAFCEGAGYVPGEENEEAH